MRKSNLTIRRRILEAEYTEWKKKTIYEKFLETRARYPDAPFFIDSRVHTYREVGIRIERMIGCLKKKKIQRGDRIVLSMGNRLEYVELTFACAAIGAVKVAVNQNAGIAELEYIVNLTEPALVFIDREKLAKEAKQRLKLATIISFEKSRELQAAAVGGEDLSRCGDATSRMDIEHDPDAVCDIIFTSGSTGNPKGAMLTHDMLLTSAYINCRNRGIVPGWRIYVPLPLFHVYGYVEGLLSVLLVGGSIVVTQGKYHSDKAVYLMNYWQVTDILSVPFIMAGILKNNKLKTLPPKELQAVYCSASICPEWIWKKIRFELKVQEITTGYGMTEVCGATVQNDPLDISCAEKGMLGKVITGGNALNYMPVIQYRIVDPETGEDVKEGIPGELICKGSVVMKGYFREEKITQNVFDREGWFHTGDIGSFTKEGYLKLEGRLHDTYRMNGENVSPQFLDSLISRCPEVAMVETVGLPDEKLGFVGAAFIEPISSEWAVLNRIIEYCKEELASYQMPAWFFFEKSDSWPRTSTGKIQKKRLREKATKIIKEI